jgi:hypothetical protein
VYWIVIRASVNFTVCVYNYDTVICGLAMFAHYVLYCMMLYVHIMYIYTHIYLGYVVFIFFVYRVLSYCARLDYIDI